MEKKTYLLSFISGLIAGILGFFVLRYIQWELPIIGDMYYLLVGACIAFPLALFVGNTLFKKFKALLQLVKFLEVGVLNTLIDFAVLNLLLWQTGILKGNVYLVFIGTAFTIAAVNSYIWNKYWTFEKKETGVATKEFGKFYLITVVSLLIREVVAHVIVNVIGSQFGLTEVIWANIGSGLGILIAFTWNFLGYKLIVFKK